MVEICKRVVESYGELYLKKNMENKFKVGETIKVIANCAQASREHNGESGVITKVTLDRWPESSSDYAKQCGDYHYEINYDYVVWENDLESICPTKREWKVGDVFTDNSYKYVIYDINYYDSYPFQVVGLESGNKNVFRDDGDMVYIGNINELGGIKIIGSPVVSKVNQIAADLNKLK